MLGNAYRIPAVLGIQIRILAVNVIPGSFFSRWHVNSDIDTYVRAYLLCYLDACHSSNAYGFERYHLELKRVTTAREK